MVLKTPALLDENVCLLCLPRPGVDIEQESCTVTGYLSSDTTSVNDGILREDRVNILEDNLCGHNSTSDTLVCGDHVTRHSDCGVGLGAGAPLACHSDGHYYLGGVTVTSSLCQGATSSFIKMSKFSEWLLENYASIRY